MAEDEDVPPLEDMSDLLQQVDVLREFQVKPKPIDVKQDNSVSAVNNHATTSNARSSKDKSEVTKENYDKPLSTDIKTKPAQTFGGMKKGFLFSSKKTSTAKSKSERLEKTTPQKRVSDTDMPYITASDPSTRDKQFEMPEVQAAMEASQSLLQNKEWVTDDLLTKVQKNETLVKNMSNPAFMKAVAEFQKDPTGAMKKYGDNPEMQKFLSEFCGLLGDHFTSLADKPESTAVPPVQAVAGDSAADLKVCSSTNPHQPTADDEAKMQQILSDPETREVLLDPRIQKLIEVLRTDPDKAQRTLQTADQDLQLKIKKLVTAGLLQFQR